MTEVKDIRPFVRYAQTIKITDKIRFSEVRSYDHRLFYVKRGEGRITVDGSLYEATHGDLFLFGSGTEYSLHRSDSGVLELIALSFDLKFDSSDLCRPIPPSKKNAFDPSAIIEQKEGTILSSPIVQRGRRDMEAELTTIYKEYKNKLLFYEQKISGALLSLIIGILRREECNAPGIPYGKTERILELIHAHYGEPLDNKKIGQLTGYHENHVNRLLVRHTGMSLHKYLSAYRIERAMELLESTDAPISEIALSTGFVDLTHFSKLFKKVTGYTPSGFRKG
jgi:AraC-like DNA-binding protein